MERSQAEAMLRAEGYLMIRSIGKGQTGDIWLVLYQATGVLRVAKEVKPTSQKLLLLRIWAGFSHSGLVKIYDLLQAENQCLCIMEYVKGQNLKEYIRKKYEETKISERRIAQWGMELCEILSYLHRQQPAVLYQDLKPSNVICSESGKLKLIDPDGAGFLGEGFSVSGTEGFLAPEQREGGKLDARTDLYGLGRTLQWILEKSVRKKRSSGYEIQRILSRCTEDDPEKRYADCEALKKEWKDFLHIRRRMCIFLGILLILVICLGRVEVSVQDAQKREKLYQQYLNQNDISDYKSAIFLFPNREKGYQQFFNFIIQDGKVDRQEHQELASLFQYTEKSLEKNREAYRKVTYELGLIYCFLYQEEGGWQYGNNWLSKFVRAIERDGSEKEQSRYYWACFLMQKEKETEKMAELLPKLLEFEKKEEADFLEHACWQEAEKRILCYEMAWIQAGISRQEIEKWKRGVEDQEKNSRKEMEKQK